MEALLVSTTRCVKNTTAHLHLSKCSYSAEAEFVPNSSSPGLSTPSSLYTNPCQGSTPMARIHTNTSCFKKTQIYLHLNPWHARSARKENTKTFSVFDTAENVLPCQREDNTYPLKMPQRLICLLNTPL